MKRRVTRCVLGALLLTSALTALNVGTSVAAESEPTSIQDCVSEKRNLDVLMLVDESSSLKGDAKKNKPGNDPDDLRVDALRSIAQVLASTVDASTEGLGAAKGKSGFNVTLSIAGFGAAYTTRKNLDELNGESLAEFVESINEQRDFDSDNRTRYHTGLKGALDDFISHKKSGKESCRLLGWVSDGIHQDDGNTGFVKKELDQIKNDLCGEGSIVDQLRAEDVFIVAAGLNSSEEELGLMKLIAAGGAPFEQASLPSCGALPPTGVFERASNAEEIIGTIFQVLDGVPGVPTEKVSLPKCADGTENCNEIAFTADGNISSFTILATRPSTSVTAELKMPTGQTVLLFPKSGENLSQKNVARFFPVSDTKVLIAVSRSKEATIDGKWSLQFRGIGSATSKGAVNFVGKAQIAINGTSASKEPLKINRFETSKISVNVKATSSETSVRGVQMSLANFEAVENLEASMKGLGEFEIAATSIEGVLTKGALQSSSSATLKVIPVGDVPGLTTDDGKPVKVEFNSENFEVLISNGEQYPLFKGIKEKDILFKGTPTNTVTLQFDGPDGADGIVKIGKFPGSGEYSDFEVVESKKCVVEKKQSDVECTVKIVLNKDRFLQDFNLPLPVTYESTLDGDPLPGEISIPVSAIKPTNPGKGILAAVELIAIFVVIQALVRLLLSYLMSRFAPLVATARRVRLDAVVDSSGGLTINPMNVNLSQSDEAFTFENVDSTTGFNIFGYQFGCSVLRTFMKSTSRPVGFVSRDSYVVIGSRGLRSSKSEPQNTHGLVELSLRGQWIVGVSATQLQTLVNGEMSIPAEVVAFFEPYEMLDRAQQLSDLNMTIASSNFSSEFADVISRMRTLAEEEQAATDNSSSSDVFGSDSGISGSSGTLVVDAFGESVVQGQPQMSDDVKKKPKVKREKKSKKESEQVTSSDSGNQPTTDDWDPFA